MSLSKILILLMTLAITQSASAARFFEQGKCTGFSKLDDTKVELTLLSDYDPCVTRRKFNSLIDIAIGDASEPNILVDHQFVTGYHYPTGAIGNEGRYTGYEGKKIVFDLNAEYEGSVTLTGITGTKETDVETITLKCELPQICYSSCSKRKSKN